MEVKEKEKIRSFDCQIIFKDIERRLFYSKFLSLADKGRSVLPN